jgi:putative peptidoglycan lipid II flippase
MPSSSRTGARAASLVAAGILLSRITGLVRERVFAHYFGNSLYADAWRAALRIPNVIQNLLGEGTLSASLIPIYSEFLAQGREKEAGRFAGAALGILLVVTGLLAFLGVLLAPVLVKVILAGFDAEAQRLTTGLVRVLFPMTGILVLSAWALGILNSHRRFFVSYAAPVLWNVAMITTLVALGAYLSVAGRDLVVALAWGALVGGVLQLAVQLPFVAPLLRHFRVSMSLQVAGVRDAIRNFIPVVAARGVVNLSGLLDAALAAWLTTGALAVLGYAQTLYLLPISLFGMSVAASELPELSRQRGGDTAVLVGRVSEALGRVAFLVIPSALAYVFLGDTVVGALYGTGAFEEVEILVTYGVLAAYALGLVASASSRVLSSAFYALQDTRTPARIAYLRVAASLVLGATLMFPMDRFGIADARFGAAGLALGASCGAWIEYVLLRRRLSGHIGRHGPGVERVLRMLLAGSLGAAAGVAAYLAFPAAGPALERLGEAVPLMAPRTVVLVAEAAGTLIPFGVVYLAATWILGVGVRVRRPASPPDRT